MKRLAIIVTAISALAVVGCKKKEEKPVDSEMPKTEAAAKPTDTMPTDPAATPPVDPNAAPADPAAAAAGAPTEDMTSGITECDDLVKRYNACAKLPEDQRKAFLDGAKAWKVSATTGGDDVKKATADSCKQATASADEALKALGC